MPPDPYLESIRAIARAVVEYVPRDIGEVFREYTGLSRRDFRPVGPRGSCTAWAVDGSNVTVLDAPGMTVVAVRAGFSRFRGGEREPAGITPVLLHAADSPGAGREFSSLYEECFGVPPRNLPNFDDPSRAAAAIRDTYEYWVALACARRCARDDLLLLDGALRVSEECHDPVLVSIIKESRDRGIHLVAVAKRTAATWGGKYPLLPAVGALAQAEGLRSPWWVKIGEDILDRTRYAQWEHGDVYVCSLARGKTVPLKVELPRGTPEQAAGDAFSLLSACADDARVEGYPYPLLDVHRHVAINADVLEKVRSDLMAGFADVGLRASDVDVLFGDYHDTFGRY
ncbi:MAG: DNA double-strand break repair nuclease NurA [Methanolinea sp.]